MKDARDRELACGQDSFLDVALGTIHQGLDFIGIEPDFGWTIGKKF